VKRGRRRRRPPPLWPEPYCTIHGRSVHLRDPWDGCSHSWPVEYFDLLMKYWDASIKFGLTIAELWYMTVAADPTHYFWTNAWIELDKRTQEAMRDKALLKLKLPIEELLAIRDRAEEGLRWYRENVIANLPPRQRMEEEAKLDAEMKKALEIRARNREKAELALKGAANGQ
jgi:hypothetical protein